MYLAVFLQVYRLFRGLSTIYLATCLFFVRDCRGDGCSCLEMVNLKGVCCEISMMIDVEISILIGLR